MRQHKYKFEEEFYKSFLAGMYARHEEKEINIRISALVAYEKAKTDRFRVIDERMDELPYE